MIKRYLIGDTIQLTWVNSGVIPSNLNCAIYDGSESLVDSGSMTGSGNGHYYFEHTTINTPGFYVSQTLAMINGKPFKNRKEFQVILGEVD